MAEREFIMEAVIEENSGHSVPELRLLNSFDDSFYLRVQKTDLVVEAPEIIEEVAIVEQPAPIIQEAIVIPEPVVIVEPEPVIIPEPIVVVEEVIAIPEPIIIPAPVAEPIIQQTVEEDEDDFWADFFVQGVDTIVYDYGTYYMSLYVNEDYVGEIEVLMEGDYIGISLLELKNYTSDQLTEEANIKLFSNEIDYISVEELEALGIEAFVDVNNFYVYLNFPNVDMPWKFISVAGLDRKVTYRPISGAETIDKENFSVVSRITSSLTTSLVNKNRFSWSLSLNFDNSVDIFDYYLDFGFSLYARNNNVQLSFGNWKIKKIFAEQMLVAEAGNVSTTLLSPAGKALGLSIKKDFSNALPGTKKPSVLTTDVLIETESNLIIYNEGKKMFERTLKPGNYKLEDFILHAGLNTVDVVIEPLNGSPAQELSYDFSYASSLLAPSEYYYGAAIALGRESISSVNSKRAGTIAIPAIGNKANQYDLRNFSISGYYNVGLTKSSTINAAIAFSNTPAATGFTQKLKLNVDSYNANPLGVLKANIGLSLQRDIAPVLSLKIGQQISIDSDWLKNVNLSLSYNSPFAAALGHTFALSAAGSGRITNNLSWNGSGSLTLNTASLDNSPYSINTGFSWSPMNNVSITTGLSLTETSLTKAPKAIARVSGSISFDKAGTSNYSFDNNSSSMRYRVALDDVSLSANIDAPSITELAESTLKDYDTTLSAGTTFNRFSIDGSLSTNFDASYVGLSLAASTNLMYAGGAFGLSSNYHNKYLLIKQDPSIRDNHVSLSYPGSSRNADMTRLFGSYLHTELVSGGYNSFNIVSANENNSFIGITSRDINTTAAKRGAYVYTIVPEEVYQVSGLLKINGLSYAHESSPIYVVKYTEDGMIELVPDSSYYMFTDAVGRFVLSDIEPGTYAFDLQDRAGNWNLCIIEINSETCSQSNMNLFEISSIDKDTMGLDYAQVVRYSYLTSLNEAEYWEMVDAEWEAAI